MQEGSGRRIAGYRLQRLIGEGAHGQVYLADDLARARTVALKLVPLDGADDNLLARNAFLAAAETAQRLVHPVIVAVWAAGIEGRYGWLAMECVPGGDLSAYTRAARLMPPARAVLVAERVALGLAHAHRQGVVHRDLKPANVLVHWPSDTVKLADFGLARAADALQTGTGLVPGSPAYMAPEQLAAAVPTPQSDFYALGVMLFELLSGRLPHEGHSMGELLRRVAQEPAPDLRTFRPELPQVLSGLVARLLAKRPAERPADGEALAQELRAVKSVLSPPD